MERRLISADEIREVLATLDNWKAENGSLVKRFEFKNFSGALAFVNKTGEIADVLDHHPDIKLGWGYAELSITTHDRGGITDFDIETAKKIDQIDQ